MNIISILILATILYASWRFGQPIVHRKEMIKKDETGQSTNEETTYFD